jgi:hypothetical protein
LNDNLKNTLLELLKSNRRSNPALNTLLHDYTNYHLVLVVVGTVMVLVLLALSLFLLARFRNTPRDRSHKWTFEKKIYCCSWIICTFVSLTMALIVAANVSNVLNPQHGFALLVDSLETPHVGSPRETLLQAFDSWLLSENTHIPPTVQLAINNRLSWQRPKAMICSILLVFFTLLSTWIWRSLLTGVRTTGEVWNTKDAALFATGLGTVAIALLMMVMALANMQAAFAPITLTLMFS